MNSERRSLVLIVVLGALIAPIGSLLRALHVPFVIVVGIMIGAIATQCTLLVRMRMRGDCACTPLWQRIRF